MPSGILYFETPCLGQPSAFPDKDIPRLLGGHAPTNLTTLYVVTTALD